MSGPNLQSGKACQVRMLPAIDLAIVELDCSASGINGIHVDAILSDTPHHGKADIRYNLFVPMEIDQAETSSLTTLADL
jgi:hypothetical protein